MEIRIRKANNDIPIVLHYPISCCFGGKMYQSNKSQTMQGFSLLD